MKNNNNKKLFAVYAILIYTCLGLNSIAYTKTLTQNTIEIENRILTVEIARLPHEHKHGLMFRKTLKENQGMLFIFKKSKHLSFWMKNTYIPLDIAFFDENKILIEYKSMTPLSLNIVKSSKKAKYALEVNKNWFAKHNIKIGSKLIINKQTTKGEIKQ